MRRAALGLAFALFLFAILEAGSAAALFLLEHRYGIVYSGTQRFALLEHQRYALEAVLAGRAHYTAYDSELGWSILPNGRSELYRANSMGIRGDREYASAPAPGVLRVTAFGDSFTHGTDVANEDTWEAIIESMSPSTEVLNFGVGAYGLDQALLRYRRDGRGLHAQVVLIGFLSENINRSVSVFRPFYVHRTGAPFAKPRFRLEHGKLVLEPNPMHALGDYRALLDGKPGLVERLGRFDFFYQRGYRHYPADFLFSARLAYTAYERVLLQGPYRQTPGGRVFNERSEAYKVTERLFDTFYAEVEAEGAVPVIVLFPHEGDLRRFKRSGTRTYAALIEHFRARGYRFIDMLDGITRYESIKGDKSMFVKSRGHYSRPGNEMVARTVLDYLREQGLDRATPDTGGLFFTTPPPPSRAVLRAALRARAAGIAGRTASPGSAAFRRVPGW